MRNCRCLRFENLEIRRVLAITAFEAFADGVVRDVGLDGNYSVVDTNSRLSNKWDSQLKIQESPILEFDLTSISIQEHVESAVLRLSVTSTTIVGGKQPSLRVVGRGHADLVLTPADASWSGESLASSQIPGVGTIILDLDAQLLNEMRGRVTLRLENEGGVDSSWFEFASLEDSDLTPPSIAAIENSLLR